VKAGTNGIKEEGY
jgi:hypothetical protein